MPPALRILLLALAVIDDLGAIVVIALFYSSGISVGGLAVAAAGIVLILLMQKLGFRSPWSYVLPGLVTWAGVYASGVHPTIAGVVIGLCTPVRAWFGPDRFVDRATAAVEAVRADNLAGDGNRLHARLSDLNVARQEAVSPVERIQHALHGWVAFAIMPLFALANAGVTFGDARLSGDGATVLLGVIVGLVVGKPVGVMCFSWLAVRAGAAALPSGVRWSDVLVVGLVAGIGFTMALFIATLAFPPGPLIEVAKLGILLASLIAGVIGLAAGRLLLRVDDAARGRPDTGRGGTLDDGLTRGSAVAQAIEVVAEVDLLDDVDHQFLEALRGQAQRLAHRAQVRVLGEVDLAVGGVHGGDQLQQPLLQRGRVGGERLGRDATIEALRVELVDVEGEIHRQAGHFQDAAEQALDRVLLLAVQPVVGVGGLHQQVGDERQAVFHRHGALGFSVGGARAVKSRPAAQVDRANRR